MIAIFIVAINLATIAAGIMFFRSIKKRLDSAENALASMISSPVEGSVVLKTRSERVVDLCAKLNASSPDHMKVFVAGDAARIIDDEIEDERKARK